MKKTLALILTAILCFSFAACGKTSDEPTQTVPAATDAPVTTAAPADTTQPVVNVAKYNLKQTVSTDIVDFTLEDCQLSYYVSNSSTNYVEPTETPNTLFAARMGTCYVSMTVTITNKDRGGSINFCGSFANWNPAQWNVTYNGGIYEMYGFNLNQDNYKNIDLAYAALINKDTGSVISKVGSSNKLISAGQTVTIRMFGIIHTDPLSLKDAFDLEVKVPTSASTYDSFVYTIPARA